VDAHTTYEKGQTIMSEAVGLESETVEKPGAESSTEPDTGADVQQEGNYDGNY
jgi:hypothetical protein